MNYLKNTEALLSKFEKDIKAAAEKCGSKVEYEIVHFFDGHYDCQKIVFTGESADRAANWFVIWTSKNTGPDLNKYGPAKTRNLFYTTTRTKKKEEKNGFSVKFGYFTNPA